MEIKTCEEYVLRELENKDKEIAKRDEEITKLNQVIENLNTEKKQLEGVKDYGDRLIAALREEIYFEPCSSYSATDDWYYVALRSKDTIFYPNRDKDEDKFKFNIIQAALEPEKVKAKAEEIRKQKEAANSNGSD